jgi:hypothetical protein
MLPSEAESEVRFDPHFASLLSLANLIVIAEAKV